MHKMLMWKLFGHNKSWPPLWAWCHETGSLFCILPCHLHTIWLSCGKKNTQDTGGVVSTSHYDGHSAWTFGNLPPYLPYKMRLAFCIAEMAYSQIYIYHSHGYWLYITTLCASLILRQIKISISKLVYLVTQRRPQISLTYFVTQTLSMVQQIFFLHCNSKCMLYFCKQY